MIAMSKGMLYYCKITESEGVDTTERQDVVRNNHILSSKPVLNSMRFVTSTFSKTETLTMSLIFAMNVVL